MTSTDQMMARAAAHLDRAADVADARGDWAFAAQIRLAAATLPGRPDDPDYADTQSEGGEDLVDHLGRALDALDAIAPLDGPADLQLCAWHIHELRRIATESVAS